MKICNDNCSCYPCSLVQPSGYQCAYEALKYDDINEMYIDGLYYVDPDEVENDD